MELDLLGLVDSEILVMIPVLYLISLFLKQTPKIPQWIITWILLAIALIVCFIYYGPSNHAFVQAVLVTGIASLAYDIILVTLKRVTKKTNHDHNDP